MNNHYYWIHWSRNVFRKRIAVLREVITKRLLPTFDLTDQEGSTISDETWERLNAIDDPDGDPAMDADAAEEAGIDYYQAMNDAKQGLLNLFAVALHHLVEQQQLTVIRQEFVKADETHEAKKSKSQKIAGKNQGTTANPFPKNDALRSFLSKNPKIFVEFKVRMSAAGIEIGTLPSYAKLDELRLLANTIKHAAGYSVEELRAKRPDIFVSPDIGKVGQPSIPNPSYWPFEPLSGQDIYVSPNDLEQYFDAADSFWREFEEALASAEKMRPDLS